MFPSIMVCQQINLPNQSGILWAYSCAGMNFAAVELFLLKGKGEKWLLYLTFSASIRSFQLMERLCWQFAIDTWNPCVNSVKDVALAQKTWDSLRERPHLFFLARRENEPHQHIPLWIRRAQGPVSEPT